MPSNSILKIDQTEPQRKPPLIIVGVLLTCLFIILAFGIFGLVAVFLGVIKFTPSFIIFVILFGILPFWGLLDLFIFDRRYYKIGKSYVEHHVQITSGEDIEHVFEQSRSALGEMKAFIFKKDTPKFLKARLGKSIIMVRLESTETKKTIINMSSDAQWMTVKFDLGENQNNINKFQSIIERLATMDEMQKQAQSQGEVQKLFGKNVKFTNEELGDIEIKYLSWGDAKKVAKFIDEKKPRSFASKVIFNQLIHPQLKLEEIEKWSDVTLEEVASKFLENEESIKGYFEQSTANGFFEKFYSAFKQSNDSITEQTASLIRTVQSQYEEFGKQMSSITTVLNSQLKSAFQALSSYDFQNLARTMQIVQNMPKFTIPPYLTMPSSLSSLAFAEKSPNVISDFSRNSKISVPNVTIGILLNSISPDLERKRQGAWQTFRSKNVDRISQSTNSLREVLRQLLDILAPEGKVINACWYVKPKEGTPVRRKMRIRYALAGDSPDVSESTLKMIDSLSDAVESVYAKLSAQSHEEKSGEYLLAEGCLNACEAIMMLVLGSRD